MMLSLHSPAARSMMNNRPQGSPPRSFACPDGYGLELFDPMTARSLPARRHARDRSGCWRSGPGSRRRPDGSHADLPVAQLVLDERVSLEDVMAPQRYGIEKLHFAVVDE